jgi:hypothetical protein
MDFFKQAGIQTLVGWYHYYHTIRAFAELSVIANSLGILSLLLQHVCWLLENIMNCKGLTCTSWKMEMTFWAINKNLKHSAVGINPF